MKRVLQFMWFLAVLLMAAGPSRAAEQKHVPGFANLPENVRERVLLGLPRHSSTIPSNSFGTQTVIMEEGPHDNVQVEKLADAIADAGYKWVADYFCAGADPDAPVAASEYRWAKLRPHVFKYAEALKQRDISLIIRLDPVQWGPQPAGRLDSELTSRRAEVFTRHIVRQLKPYVRHWRIWNEPNLGGDVLYATPEQYVRLAALMAKVIREEQPDAIIYGPGVSKLQCLAEEPNPWIRQALEKGLMDHIDVFAYHPYRHPFTAQSLPELPSTADSRSDALWPSYEAQIADLRKMLRQHVPDREIPLAVTEDGMPIYITADGEQPITPVVQAKYELRRSLIDHWLDIRPRIMFTIKRGYPDVHYNLEHSFDALYTDDTPKPIYFAVQNLHAVLDDTYERAPEIDAVFIPDAENSNVSQQVQVYRKDHGDFEELLAFYWAKVASENVHQRAPGRLVIRDSDWVAPLECDLMKLPGSAYDRGAARMREDIVRQPLAQPVTGTHDDKSHLSVTTTLRDYPMLIKAFRLKDQP